MKKKSSPYKSMFLAVELEEDLKQQLAERLYLLEDKIHLRIESRRNFHITIGFIAHVHEKHRRDVINCFKPLKEFSAFLAHVEGPVILGQYQQILCAKYGPDQPFQMLHEKAKDLLTQHTEYTFDEKHELYIPHTKIQSIRKAANDEEKQILVDKFMNCNFRKLDFKVKTLALMQRQDKHFEIVHKYPLSNGITEEKKGRNIHDIY